MSESEAVRVHVEFGGDGEAFVKAIRQSIRVVQPALGSAAREEEPNWVLVKGYHDSGTINGVYGPYAEACIDWLLAGLLEYTSDNWTKVKLSNGPEDN